VNVNVDGVDVDLGFMVCNQVSIHISMDFSCFSLCLIQLFKREDFGQTTV